MGVETLTFSGVGRWALLTALPLHTISCIAAKITNSNA